MIMVMVMTSWSGCLMSNEAFPSNDFHFNENHVAFYQLSLQRFIGIWARYQHAMYMYCSVLTQEGRVIQAEAACMCC
jgi:hypothetical protein